MHAGDYRAPNPKRVRASKGGHRNLFHGLYPQTAEYPGVLQDALGQATARVVSMKAQYPRSTMRELQGAVDHLAPLKPAHGVETHGIMLRIIRTKPSVQYAQKAMEMIEGDGVRAG